MVIGIDLTEVARSFSVCVSKLSKPIRIVSSGIIGAAMTTLFLDEVRLQTRFSQGVIELLHLGFTAATQITKTTSIIVAEKTRWNSKTQY